MASFDLVALLTI